MAKLTDRIGLAVDARTLAAGIVLSVGAFWCWTQAGKLESRRAAHVLQMRRLESMRADVAVIQELNRARPVATDRRKPNDELLAQVGEAAARAGVPPDGWVSSDPLPAVRIPNAPYRRLAMRITFTSLSLRTLVQFCTALTGEDPTLGIAALRISSAQHADKELWDADIQIEYLVYSPQS